MRRDALVSLGLAIVVMIACRQITLDGACAPNPGYRAQVDALLDGRLAITRSPDGLAHDLAWTEDGVQQVWGLGVPLWQAPFEAAARAVGAAPFPDRVAMLVWLALTLFAVLRAFRPYRSRDRGADDAPADSLDEARAAAGWRWPAASRWPQVGAVALTALLPALTSVLRGRIGVYEEAAIYAYGAAMMLLAGVIAVGRRASVGRYLPLMALAGATGLIRPTVWFYGLATLIVASAIVWQRRGDRPGRAARTLALGAALFVAGGGALYATNAARFGRGSEFGHRLNVHSLPGNIVATRFGYPFERARLGEAAEELFGSLFDRPELRSRRGFYQPALHRGQSARPRWREYYFTTFSWPYLPAILAGLWLGARALRRRRDPEHGWSRGLAAWAVLGAAPLFVFYLRSPSVSSRYQLDLAPAIAALLVIAWRAASTRWPRAGIAVLAGLWITAIATSKVTRPRRVSDPVDRSAASAAAFALSRPPGYEHPLPGAYDLADPFLPMWLDLEGEGSFVRCVDGSGAVRGCDEPSRPGDGVVRGARTGRQWTVERAVIPARPPTEIPACPVPGQIAPAAPMQTTAERGPAPEQDPPIEPARPDDDLSGASHARHDPAELTCTPATPLGDDPSAAIELAFVAPPSLYLNGFGWDLATGSVPPATVFYVDDPAYVALEVVGPPGTDWASAVRVALGLDHLPLIAVAETVDGARLRFASGARRGLWTAFVAFGPDDALDQPRSAFGLRSLRWRD